MNAVLGLRLNLPGLVPRCGIITPGSLLLRKNISKNYVFVNQGNFTIHSIKNMTTTGKLGIENKKDNVHNHSHDVPSEDDHVHSHGASSLFGHSHSHSAHNPNELLMSGSIKNNPAVRITWIGLFVNVALAVSKGIGGVYFHSQALVADAIHSVSDMVADFLTLATVNVATKVGTPTNFPLGYGKIEAVGSLLVSGVLLFAGISVGWSSLLQVFEFVLPTYMYEYASMIQIGHSHTHAHGTETHSHEHSHMDTASELPNAELANTTLQIPNMNAAWLAGGSIIVKELLFRKTLNIAEETNSKVLVANAWHHRVDSLTALVALVTVTGGNLFNVVWLDSIGGFLVSILIIKAGWGTFKEALNELIDKGENSTSEPYMKFKNAINSELESNIELQDFEISQLSVMSAGANSNVYVTLSSKLDQDYSLSHLNKLEVSLADALKKDDTFLRNVFVNFKEMNRLKLQNESDKHVHDTKE